MKAILDPGCVAVVGERDTSLMNSPNSRVNQAAKNSGRASEESLIRLYVELTGASEAEARDVFMHPCCREAGHGCEIDPERGSPGGTSSAELD